MIITKQYLILFLLGCTFAALGLGFSAEYFYGIKPCVLCLYQRYLFFCLCGGLLGSYFYKKLLFLPILILSLGILLSLYHGGLEMKWWNDLFSFCVIDTASFSRANFLDQLDEHVIRCDQVHWKIFNVSAVFWTLLFQMSMLGILMHYPRKMKRPRF